MAAILYGLAAILAYTPAGITVTQEITAVTEPIAADGLPDFAAVVLDLAGRGIAPSENAAIDFWKALGPPDLSPEDRSLFWEEIGCEAPNPDRVVTSIDFLTPEQLRTCQRHPFWSEKIFGLEEWLQANQPALDQLSLMRTKTKFYSPPPNLLGQEPAPLINAWLVDVDAARRALPALLLRSQACLGTGDFKTAYSDLAVADRLAEVFERHFALIGVIDGLRWRVAVNRARSVLIDRADSVSLLKQLAAADQDYADHADRPEHRLAFLNRLVVVDTLVGDWSPRWRKRLRWKEASGVKESGLLERVSVLTGFLDANAALEVLNARYDRLDEIVRKSSLDRKRFWQESVADMESFDEDRVRESHLAGGDSHSIAMSKTIGEMYFCLLCPDADAVFTLADSAVAYRRLEAIAALLRVQHLQTGRYPESADSLDYQPLDPFSGEPFRYQRRGDGFVLWSVGENGVDDSANDADGDFVDGEYAPIDWFGERDKPEGVDDLVVRLPVPALRLPDTFESPE